MVKQVEVSGDQVITGTNGIALVSSKSEPGAWHSVRNNACDCKGYQYRGRCRHVAAVAVLIAQPAPAVNPTFALSARTLAGAFGGRKHREGEVATVPPDGETISYAEWRERRAS